ncbi:helix-turn-helix domain-containing protein [Pedobacter sp. HMF7647]|uniref:Helix-turn-helix domain-containing protein n=1 Tax=Hufsiella arboris TaxID=2695275 RepID=A0A7K1YFL6_9SPHI|nr:helix-turn-helix domain-containing protein [Hufsiella arboris]MXV53230.1 helix-turn-helix domain-containing protein [Hufsiella arboris]
MIFSPVSILRPYIKSYTVITIEKDLENEVFYPSGYIDFVVNIAGGSAATIINGERKDTPQIELLGHLTVPTKLMAAKNTRILIARIYPYAASLFFNNPVADFTNYATNLHDVFGQEIRDFNEQLLMTSGVHEQINVMDNYFISKLKANEKKLQKILLMRQLCSRICADYESFDMPAFSNDFGMSERKIQNLFLNHVGLNPAGFFSVNRFNKSLDLVLGSQLSLTFVSYECGYYDQAHFIKDFKKFTGITPSEARLSLVKNGQDFQQAVNIGF